MTPDSFIPKLFDPYDRPARLYPGLLVVVPMAVLLVSLYGTNHVLLAGAVSILGFCGIAFTLGRIARDAGKRVQDELFFEWGGAPTTQLLRHSNTHFDVHTKERYHGILSKGLKKTLPAAESERGDPDAADELYRAATLWLIDQTRDTKVFPLVFKENVAFGFHRNSLGLRWYGVFVSIICIVWALLHAKILVVTAPFYDTQRLLNLDPSLIITVAVSAVMLFVWCFVLNENALKRAGFSYAERLLQSCDRLTPTARSTKKICNSE